MDYVNLPDASAKSNNLKSGSRDDGGVTAAVPGETENLQFKKNFKFYP